MAIALKDANETLYWIELIEAAGYSVSREHPALRTATQELVRILAAIVKSTRNN